MPIERPYVLKADKAGGRTGDVALGAAIADLLLGFPDLDIFNALSNVVAAEILKNSTNYNGAVQRSYAFQTAVRTSIEFNWPMIEERRHGHKA